MRTGLLCLLLTLGCASYTTTPTGLQYSTEVEGRGDPARPGDHVSIHETVRFENGEVYFTTRDSKPVRFLLGGNQAIEGLDEGVTGMRVGEQRRMIIPPALSQRTAYPDGLPPEVTLYYEVELVEIEAGTR